MGVESIALAAAQARRQQQAQRQQSRSQRTAALRESERLTQEAIRGKKKQQLGVALGSDTLAPQPLLGSQVGGIRSQRGTVLGRVRSR